MLKRTKQQEEEEDENSKMRKLNRNSGEGGPLYALVLDKTLPEEDRASIMDNLRRALQQKQNPNQHDDDNDDPLLLPKPITSPTIIPPVPFSCSKSKMKMKEVVPSPTLSSLSNYSHSKSSSKGSSSTSTVPGCVICKDNNSNNNSKAALPRCKHLVCKEYCLPNYLKERMEEDVWEVRCPDSDCKTHLRPSDCRDAGLIPVDVYEKWNAARTEARVLGSLEVIVCPFNECRKVFANDGKGSLIRACPKCWRLFCMECRVPWHTRMTCIDFRSRNNTTLFTNTTTTSSTTTRRRNSNYISRWDS